jgi:hypothetical protein
MAENIRMIAAKLGASIVGQVPDVGGGAFGAAKLANYVAAAIGRPVRCATVMVKPVVEVRQP